MLVPVVLNPQLRARNHLLHPIHVRRGKYGSASDSKTDTSVTPQRKLTKHQATHKINFSSAACRTAAALVCPRPSHYFGPRRCHMPPAWCQEVSTPSTSTRQIASVVFPQASAPAKVHVTVCVADTFKSSK
ncbi:hypothetical protein ONZ51_g10195 [Trametes cubensis]|uniref:Uncharacterized protein n=1 Tax=Trametes cubensis TaxID=1111947 RepID=A0AAD7TKI2_9APHY|nr:hypothetical protein ONZ51_g10195 [Trametes cubensis]